MKRKLTALLCAAGMMLTTVPAFPVFAAEESTEQQATDTREITDDGDLMASASAGDSTWLDCFNVGNAGTVDYTAGICGSHQFSWKDVKNAQFELFSSNRDLSLSRDQMPGITYNYAAEFDLGDTGWYGISVLSRYNGNWFYIVDGWAENSTVRSSAGTKLGTVSADGLEYEVYRCDQQDDKLNLRIPNTYPVYWLFSATNRYDKNSLAKNAVPVGRLINQLYVSELDAQMKQPDYSVEPQMLVCSGLDAAGKASGSAKFRYCWYGIPPVIENSGKNISNWIAGTAYNLGTFDVSCEEDGSFSLSWDDVEGASFLYQPFGYNDMPDMELAVGKTWKYAGEADLGEYGYFGPCIFNGMDFCIVEGYGEKCAAWGDPEQSLGEISVNGVRYDLYKTERYLNERGIELTNLYWIVRRDNQYSGANSAFCSEVPIAPIIEKTYEKLFSGWDRNIPFTSGLMWTVDSDQSKTGMVSGKAHFTKLVFEDADSYFTESGRKDGYDWVRIQKAYDLGTSMTVGENGTFTAEWKNLIPAVKALFVCGKEYNITLDDVSSISCTSKITPESVKVAYPLSCDYGYVSTFADTSGTEPVLTECCFTEAARNNSIDAAYKIGDITVDEIMYGVYSIPVTEETRDSLPVTPQHYTKQLYWIERYYDMRTGYLYASADCSFDLLTLFREAEKLGAKLNGTLTDISFFVQADYDTGSFQLLKNEINLVKEGANDPEPDVRGDANCDGVLDVSDAVLASRILVEDTAAKITDQGMQNADIDRSGNLEPADITLMLQVIAKKVVL